MYIKGYNSIIYELDEYENIKKEIQEKGYEKIKNEKIQRLISAFKEMLNYKNKSYNSEWSFKEWIEVIDKYYHFYHDDLETTLTQIQGNTLCRSIYMDYQVYIQTDEVENIIALNDLYYDLDPEIGDYKNFANFYRDIELKEGQTYEGLYNEEKEKFIELFKEMLNYINVKYEDNSFDGLKTLIRDNFPYYSDNITSLSVMMNNPTETYISLINNMEDIYNYFSKTYKDNIEGFKYELFINIDNLTRSVYEKGFNSKGYEIIYKDDNILFLKRINNSSYNQQHEKIIIEVIISMAKKYKQKGIVHIDLSNEMASILEKIKDDKNVRGYDNRITWPIRQAFTKAIISKKKKESNCYNSRPIK